MTTTIILLKQAAADIPTLRWAWEWKKTRLRPARHVLQRDVSNLVRYGAQAPRFAERLWIRPREVEYFDVRGNEAGASARVESGAWGPMQPLADDPILQASIARWVKCLPWEETGEIERMEAAISRYGPRAGCRDRAEILNRCQQLDRIFQVVERDGRIRPQAENDPRTFRELGGIGMHVGPNGAPIRAANGRHRFAIAWILDLASIPVRVGRVHDSALPLLTELRREA